MQDIRKLCLANQEKFNSLDHGTLGDMQQQQHKMQERMSGFEQQMQQYDGSAQQMQEMLIQISFSTAIRQRAPQQAGCRVQTLLPGDLYAQLLYVAYHVHSDLCLLQTSIAHGMQNANCDSSQACHTGTNEVLPCTAIACCRKCSLVFKSRPKSCRGQTMSWAITWLSLKWPICWGLQSCQ